MRITRFVYIHIYQKGATALYMAAARNHLEVARLLLDKGANVNAAKVVKHTLAHARVPADTDAPTYTRLRMPHKHMLIPTSHTHISQFLLLGVRSQQGPQGGVSLLPTHGRSLTHNHGARSINIRPKVRPGRSAAPHAAAAQLRNPSDTLV